MASSSDHNSAKPRPRARSPIYLCSTSHKESEYVVKSQKFFPIFSLVLPRMGALRMIRCISNTMHGDLMTQVNIPNFLTSSMVDTTTDSTNNHFMIVFLYFLRNNNPIVQFYRKIKIGFSENSESLYSIERNKPIKLPKKHFLTNIMSTNY
jgi:hypothetical protein